MAHTERLYYTDSYLQEFTARVLRVDTAAAGARVYLDRTALYPESGGQPSDRGTLGGIAVVDVVDEGEEVAHVLAAPPAGDTVEGRVDWQRRFDHMQQHTGQHILSAAFEHGGGYKTVSFHLGTESSTIDLDSDRVGASQVAEAEELANRVVFENRPVEMAFVTAAEAQQLNLRKPTERDGSIRLVKIAEFDLSACGGTHVSRTGGVGNIHVRKVDRAKGQARVEFVCGARALRRARQDFTLLGDAARLFSAAPESVPELISRQAQDLHALGKSVQRLVEDLAELEAASLWQQAAEKQGVRVVRCVLEAAQGNKAKFLAHAVARQAGAIGLIAAKGQPTLLIFSQTTGGKAHMAELLKRTLEKFGGRGGGSRDFAQGGGVPEAQLQEALDFAENMLA